MYPEIQLGSVTIRTYSVLCALAMLAAFVPVRSEARRLRWDVEAMSWLVLWSTLIGWVGGHVLYAFTRLELSSSEWWPLLFKFGSGNVWYGGFLLSWLFVHRYARKRGIPALQMFDFAAFAVLVAQAVGRIGCLLGGCCYGSPTTLPWSVVFPQGDYSWSPVHPTQLYEALYLAALFAWLWSTRTRRTRHGQTAALYLVFSAAGRFALEFLRGDKVRGFVAGWLSTSQFVAVLLIAFGLALYACVTLPAVKTPPRPRCSGS